MRQASDERGVRVLMRLTLPEAGPVHLRAAVIDRVSGARGSVHDDLRVPDLRSAALAMSGVAVDAVEAPSVPTALPEPGFQAAVPVPPTPRRVFTANDTLAVFAEFYVNGSIAWKYLEITCTVRNQDGALVFQTQETRPAETGTAVYRRNVPLQNLVPGAYVLAIEARVADE